MLNKTLEHFCKNVLQMFYFTCNHRLSLSKLALETICTWIFSKNIRDVFPVSKKSKGHPLSTRPTTALFAGTTIEYSSRICSW